MKVLLVSYMLGDSASGVISCRVAGEFAGQGHDVKVLVLDARKCEVHPSCEVIRVSSLSNWYTLAFRVMKKIGRTLQLAWFEEDRQWIRKCRRKVDSLLKDWTPDLVYCRSTPFAPFFVGKYIKQRYGLRVLMHFTDLLPSDSEYPSKHRLITRLSRQMRDLISYADRLSFGTAEMMEYEAELLGCKLEGRSFVSPDVVSDTELRQLPPAEGKRLTLVYFGYLYVSRNPVPLFEAVESLRREGLDCELTIYSSQAGHFGRHDGVRFVGRSADRDSALAAADIFVDLTIDDSLGRDVYVSSKMKDYLLFNRPILSISGHHCATRELVRGLRTVSTVDNDREAIRGAIKELSATRFSEEDYAERQATVESFSAFRIVGDIIEQMS